MVISWDNPSHVDRVLQGPRPDGAAGPDRAAIESSLASAGLVLLDVRQVVAPVFYGPPGLDRDGIEPGALAVALAAPEAETLTYVACAVRHGARSQVQGMAERLQAAQAALAQERVSAAHRMAVLDVEHSIAQAHLAEALSRAELFEQRGLEYERRIRGYEAHIEALLSTLT